MNLRATERAQWRDWVEFDRAMLAVDADDVAAFLDAQHCDARELEQFRALERDAAYSANERSE